MEGVVTVVTVLESLILNHLGGVDQIDRITGLHQSIDQPVPVEGGLDRNAFKPTLIF